MASNSTSSSGDAAGDAAVSKTTSFDAGDSCTWYAGQSCSQPRTGYDCLNVLLSTDECAIDPNGACVSMSVYEEYLADREYYEPLSRYFPASNYTYCSANDSVCSTCIAEWTSNYDTTGSTGTKTYCTGSDGCVCVAATEAPDWKQTVIANQCDSSSAGASSSDEFSSGTRICIILALCVGGVMIFSIFAVRRCIRLASRVPGSGSAHHAPSGPQLSLAGWKSLREKLIETEHSFVRGDTTRLDATARSAEALAEAPAVTVELKSSHTSGMVLRRNGAHLKVRTRPLLPALTCAVGIASLTSAGSGGRNVQPSKCDVMQSSTSLRTQFAIALGKHDTFWIQGSHDDSTFVGVLEVHVPTDGRWFSVA
ncbi:hypothetical protein ON010_g5948 [Phytophthora cinnamomi]|nr:hypothetical protein ON010_g5948 [Phytophthora cinnamomi]